MLPSKSRVFVLFDSERSKYIPRYRGTRGTKLQIQASYMSITISIYLKTQSSERNHCNHVALNGWML